MQALDMGLGAQIFQVDPHGCRAFGGQGGLHNMGQITAKCLDHPMHGCRRCWCCSQRCLAVRLGSMGPVPDV